THPLDDLAVYAMDALDPDERARIDVHLADCAHCRAELDRHFETLAQLTLAEEPPAHLWDRIASGIATTPAPSDGGNVVPMDIARPTAPRHSAPRSRRAWSDRNRWLTTVAAAAAAVVVVGATVWSIRGDSGPGDVSDLAQVAVDDPDSTVVELTGDDGSAQARVVMTEDGTGYVLLDHLPALPDGRSYQLWKTEGADPPISLGVIGDGSVDAAAFGLPAHTSSFAISDEPDVGVTAPTGPIVASS
ncbi:MAG TPA: anti-sigma factor, partial [Acidimicrobiales bacterium]